MNEELDSEIEDLLPVADEVTDLPSAPVGEDNSEEIVDVDESDIDNELFQALGRKAALLDYALDLGRFASSAFQPRISDVEIIVIFADLRGFTKYCQVLQSQMQDRKIQNFLKTYPRIFAHGLWEFLCIFTHPDSPKYSHTMHSIEKFLVPTFYKNLGDGMMIVWEVPQHISPHLQGQLANNVVNTVTFMESKFATYFRDLSPVEKDAYSEAVLDLDLGYGIAKGHAWKLNYPTHIDYAGAVINLAARLEGLARPKGIVAQYDVAPWLLDRRAEEGRGQIAEIESLHGVDTSVKVWLDEGISVPATV